MKNLFLILLLSAFCLAQTKMYIKKNNNQVDSIPISEISKITFNDSGTIPTDSLVAYYPFNGNANDESGNGNDLTTFGSPLLSVDRHGNPNRAYYFNGQTDYFYKARTLTLLPSDDFSLCVWFYNSGIDGEQDVIVSTLDIPDVGGYQIALGVSVEEVIGASIRPLNDDKTLKIPYTDSLKNRWVFVVFIYSQFSGLKLYIDGQLRAQNTNAMQINYGTENNFRIGTNPHSSGIDRRFKGYIDDVRFYRRVLNENEIWNLYND